MVTSIVIDVSGNVSFIDRAIDSIRSTYPGWSNGADKLLGGGFVVGGGNFDIDSLDNWIQRPVLYFFSEEGEYLSFIELGPENEEWIGRQARQTPDGGFVICGGAYIIDNTQGFVIKTDPLGQVEWIQTYGANEVYDAIISIDERNDQGYYTGGQKEFSSDVDSLWVQALDDTGGVIWEKTWGTSAEMPNAHLTTAADGAALIASGWGVGPGNALRHYLAKLNADNGEVIWQRQYGGSSTSSTFYVVQEIVPEGDLIAAGGYRSAQQYYGALLRTTANGDSLWMRYYQYSDSLVSDKQGLFRDVQPTPDGGFIACGTALAVADNYSQDVWVVKVDQYGCLEPGCHLIAGMETQITNMRELLYVWPNPVHEHGEILVQLELPEHFKPQGQLRLTITSNDGRLIQEEAITKSSTTSTLQLTQLSSGLYHIHLTDSYRWISGAKLVVE